jgi:AcrR family transcriptional regulator
MSIYAVRRMEGRLGMTAEHAVERSAQESTPGNPEVRERILEAAERLCDTQPVSEVTIRGIAAEAGVTPGLLHYYFASKSELFGATMTKMSGDYLAAMDGLSDPGEVAARLFDIVSERPGLPRLTAWMLLEQMDPLEVGSDPMAEYWLSLFETEDEPGAASARAWTALMIAAAWGVYKDYPLLGSAIDSAGEREALITGIRELMVRLARPAD